MTRMTFVTLLTMTLSGTLCASVMRQQQSEYYSLMTGEYTQK